jgi:hypothetical protein
VEKNRKLEPDDTEQSARFVGTARALEADESGKPFVRAFKKVLRKTLKKKKRGSA